MGISHKSKKRAAFGSLSLQFLLEKPDKSIPSKGRQPKPDEKPGGDQMPTGRISVAGQYQIWERPIGQKRGGLQGELGRRPKRGWPGPGSPQRLLGTFVRTKVPRPWVREPTEKKQKEAKGRLYPLPPFSAFTEGGVPPLQVICACPGKTAPWCRGRSGCR